jgi:hypothetical protein
MAYVYENPEWFMEMIRRFTGQTAPSNAAAAADRGAIVPMLAVESVKKHQPMVATALPPGPGASGSSLGSLLTMSLPLSSDNPGTCIVNMAPDIRSLETSSEEVEMENAEEVEKDTEEERAITEGRFYLLSPSPPAKRRRL